ncbi:MAG: hypothetical protein IKX10_04310 [Lachnospiraceae bacterium]|nr:hypothetical protein [Lachnospiraceae bacterium]
MDKTIALTDETVTLTITPALNYELDKVMNSASGTEIPVTPGENGKYTFAMPAERVVVSPTYKLKKYSVTFVDEDGKTVLKEATEYDYGTAASAIQKPADPTKKATEQYTYTFAGWTPKIDTVTGDVVYKATYTSKVNKYKVTFVDEDGKTILKAATEYDYGTAASAIEKPADPTKKATAQYTYTFAGWTPKIDTVTGDITYTATYSSVVNKYKVTFVDEDGKTILKAATEYDYGTAASAIKKPADPTKEATAKYTYTFAGWTPEIGKVTEDITYKATYSSVLNKFKVTFVDEDRSTVLKATAAYDYGTTFTDFEKPADPTKAATKENTFTFVGWTPETDAVTGDITYIATYSVVVNKYKVTYVDDDGITILKDAIEYAFGTSAADYEKPADPEKKATAQYTYHFTGWKPQVDTTTGDITYIATYSSVVNKYKVTFVDEDGKTILKDAIAYDYGTAASDIAKPEVPTKAETAQYTYTFAGWTPKIDMVAGDITYTATYSSVVNKYKVTFVDEDETTILKDTVEYDYGTAEKDIVKPEDPTKQATEQYTYTFAGWTPEINVVTGDITYVATYEAEEIIAPPVISYIVKSGADGIWTQNNSKGYTLTADRIGDAQKCSDHYVSTWIDQKKVPVSTKEGSIIITIAPETLKELSVGEHTIKVEFDDGFVETKLTVKAAPEPDAPIAAPTGNDGYLWLWIYALGASLASMAVMGFSGKKRRVK